MSSRVRRAGWTHWRPPEAAGAPGTVLAMPETARADGRTKRAAGTRRRRDALILDALERLLVRTSLKDLGVEQIAEAAGITRTRFYHYYKSKHEAYAALLQRVGDQV